MEKQYAPTATEKKQTKVASAASKPAAKAVTVADVKAEEKKAEQTTVEQNAPQNNVEKKEPVKPIKPVVKKEEAIAKGNGITASKKHSMYICDHIKGKSIDTAIKELEEVVKFKRVIAFKGEIPHRHGKGMMSGRYPVEASKIFISILKGLKGNAMVNGLDIDKTRIYYGSASWASRPMRKGGRVKSKRTNVVLKAKEFTEAKK